MNIFWLQNLFCSIFSCLFVIDVNIMTGPQLCSGQREDQRVMGGPSHDRLGQDAQPQGNRRDLGKDEYQVWA